MRKIVFIFPVLLAACAIDSKPFNGPNARQAYSMNCSGFGRTLSRCYKKAGELCPGGYNIVDLLTGTVVVPVNNSIMAAPKNHMAIECK